MKIRETFYEGAYVKHDGEETVFGFSTKAQKNRCQMLLDMELAKGNLSFEIEQKPVFSTIGPMIDVSRGRVVTVDGMKKIIDAVAKTGMNMLMLYTEAMYEMKKYPFFGYMNGRYTIDELKAIDDYAFERGIEVIPCIQTLGHLRTYLQWGKLPAENASVLLPGEERCYEFIEEEIKTMKQAFRSNRIHIGMDEADGLGHGNYFKKHGHRGVLEIFNEHLARVLDITDKYGYEAMIWSDMYYSSKSGQDYYDPDVIIPQDAIDSAPENAMHVFWDYYHKEYSYYDKKLLQEERFPNKIAFAGGIWTWDGFLPNFRYTYESMSPALECCINHNIETVIATLWGNGAETDYTLALSSLAVFSEYCYRGKDCRLEDIYAVGYYISGETAELTEAISAFWAGEDGSIRIGKGIIYADLLLDTYCRDTDFSEIAKLYRDSLSVIEKHKYAKYYTYYKSVFEAALLKTQIMEKLRPAYKEKDLEYLSTLCEVELPKLIEKYNDLYEEFKILWFENSKAQGFERFPIYFGGMERRFMYVQEVLGKYINQEIDKIEELEEEVLCGINTSWKDAPAYLGV